jgi:hypothetical protein
MKDDRIMKNQHLMLNPQATTYNLQSTIQSLNYNKILISNYINQYFGYKYLCAFSRLSDIRTV